MIRGNLVMTDDLAADYLESLEKMHKLSSIEGTWNKDAIDDLFAQQVLAVAATPMERRDAAITEAADQLTNKLNEPPTVWEIDLSVFGANFDLAGVIFGRITFVADNISSPIGIANLIQANTDQAFLLARVSVKAIDRKAAFEKARKIVEQHLMIRNAMCADLVPSRTHLFCIGASIQRVGISRSRSSTEQLPATRLHQERDAVVLSRQDYDSFIKRRGGARASELLVASNALAGRILSAFETAGEASIEVRAHRAFLLHAIALESVVLGKQTQSELTYQLSARIAHLLGADLNSRKSIVKTVNELHSLRSKIVHTDATEVSRSELELITQVTLNTIFALLQLKPFTEMVGIDQYEQWFKDRMLGATDDIA